MNPRPCPVCRVPLRPDTYEGLLILRCPQCQGHLLERTRFDAIRRIPGKTLAELEAEAQAGFAGDHPGPVRCPACRITMTPRPLAVPGFHLRLDLCRACALVWLDGGELALAQLAYQASPQFRDTQELKRRAEALEADPARKAAFDEALAKLPEARDPFREGLGEAFRDALFRALFHPGPLPTRL